MVRWRLRVPWLLRMPMSDQATEPSGKRPQGRPKKAAEQRQGKVVAVRFSEAGYAVLEAVLAHHVRELSESGGEGAEFTAAHLLRLLVTRRARELRLPSVDALAGPAADHDAKPGKTPKKPATKAARR